jgi:UDPglucose 6-dehydrogenase
MQTNCSLNDEDLDNIPIYEPGLENCWETRGRNLFSTDVLTLRLFFISVYKPMEKEKGCGLKYIELCARQIAKIIRTNKRWSRIPTGEQQD